MFEWEIIYYINKVFIIWNVLAMASSVDMPLDYVCNHYKIYFNISYNK